MDKAAIAELMSGLNHLSLANIEATIEKADASMLVANTLREVLTNVKKYKEVQAKLNRKDELAHMRQRQSGALMCSVFIYLTNCIFVFSIFFTWLRLRGLFSHSTRVLLLFLYVQLLM